jgi:hypothetical protein
MLGGDDFELLDTLDAIPDLTADEIQRSELNQSLWNTINSN